MFGCCSSASMHFQFPMVTEHHGLRKWDEKDSIYNANCPYALLAIGRASREKGLALYMAGAAGAAAGARGTAKARHPSARTG